MADATTRLATLGLAGDCDDLDMIRDVEHAFGIVCIRRASRQTDLDPAAVGRETRLLG